MTSSKPSTHGTTADVEPAAEIETTVDERDLPVDEHDLPFAEAAGEVLRLRLFTHRVTHHATPQVTRHTENQRRPAAPKHAVVMVHGGAWSANNRKTPTAVCRDLARRGLVVFSLDFRDGRNGKHPCAVQDITGGIRFVRRHADYFGIDAEHIGLIGSSSGGHLVLQSALQPDIDPHRGTRIRDVLSDQPGKPGKPGQNLIDPTDLSAEVGYVIALWPVSDPLRRYRYAQDTGRQELLRAHSAYFHDETQMAQASIQHILGNREHRKLPPLAVVQPGMDLNVPADMTLDLIRQYQLAEGFVEYLHYPGLPHAFAYDDSAETRQLVVDLWPFIQKHRTRRPL